MVTRRSVFCLTRNTGSEVAEGETGRGRGIAGQPPTGRDPQVPAIA